MKSKVKELTTKAAIRLKETDLIRSVVTKLAFADNLLAYVVDEDNTLVGIVTPKRLLGYSLADFGVTRHRSMDWSNMLGSLTSQTAADIMGPPLSLRLEDSIEDAVNMMLNKNLYAIPVTDSQGKLRGRITIYSILEEWANRLKSPQSD